jgi:hypothetical protein
VNAVIDTNGSCGVHNSTAGATPAFINGSSVSKNAGTKIITGSFANAGGPGSSAITFTPVASTTGQLLGAWTGAARMQVLVYSADGTAFYATPFDIQNPTGGAQAAGLDDVCLVGVVPTASTGSYTPDFTASCTVPGPLGPLPAVSTNGPQGFGPTNIATSYTVTGDDLSRTIGTTTGIMAQRLLPN